ncbi:MAG: diguanylate cyclase [Thermoanaerobaculia bacterium]|nr:diguanylate cyclase [Thermoanaerobaculia bacterium]
MSELRPRVLVVDDDPLSRRILEQVLLSAGCDVESAADGQEALSKVRKQRPDVVVTDWQMPVMDGLTLCRILKGTEETRFTHVVMLSARGETEAKVTGLETGADDYLVKPVEPVELKARVRVGLRLQKALLDLAAKNEILEKLALTDPLTGLANRRAFEEALEAELARAGRHGRPASLLFLDLDHFKAVNDSHGHAAGDEILSGFAAVLRRGCRRGDLAARIGGEEFAVLLPMTGRVPATLVAERIRRATEGHALGQTVSVPVTVSVGVASTEEGTEAFEVSRLLRRADAALYRAKAEGRNRVAAG